MSVNLKVNGVARSFAGDPAMPLLWYLRDELGLTGTKFGCGVAACGACTLHVDGQALRSCITPGVPPLGPALTNAIFAATGKRIRALPVGNQLKPGPATRA